MSLKKRLADFKNKDNYFKYLSQLFTLQVSQFEYEGLPETLPAEFLELYLLINGTVAIGKVKELENDDIYCAVGSYNGDINGYLPSEYTAAVVGLGEISGKWYGTDKTVVVGRNNSIRAPEFDIPYTADVLCQVDISESCNVLFTRFMKLPFADNDKQKQQLESAIKSIIKGDVFAVASRDISNKIDEFISESRITGDKEKFLELVDPDKINNLQYLNQYRDNVMKRFLQRRGYMMTTTSKLAQQTNAELHGSDSYSLLYPLEQLKMRKEMCENMNALFGLQSSVKFNPILEKVYKDYMSEPETEKTPTDSNDNKGQDDSEGNNTPDDNGANNTNSDENKGGSENDT